MVLVGTVAFKGARPYVGPKVLGILDDKTMDRVASEEIFKIGNPTKNPHQAVATISGGQRQRLAIARAIHFGARG